MTLVPAYNRDYRSAKEVREAFNADKDFVIASVDDPDCGRYVNKPQLVGVVGEVWIRYAKNTKKTRVVVEAST